MTKKKKSASKKTASKKKASTKKASTKKASTKKASKKKKAPTTTTKQKTPKLLSGGNPQIAKGYGDAPVQAWIAALPPWKRKIAQQVDALIVKSVPMVQKAVKWNSPFYGLADKGWFVGMHVFTSYVKVTFFRGTSLQPLPPGTSKMPETRYLDLHEDTAIDEAQLAAWMKQASLLPGEKL